MKVYRLDYIVLTQMETIMAIKLEQINARIATISVGERTFKTEMGLASRELLTYISENGDIDAVNRLLGVLTPANREKAKAFFAAHLPYTYNVKSQRFDGKSKNQDVVAKKTKVMVAFLADADSTIWTWLAEQDNGAPVAKPKEYEKKIEALVKKALEDKEENIPVSAVIRAIIKGGASLTEIMSALLPEGETKGEEEVKKAA